MENKLIIPQSHSSLGFFAIIKESFKTTKRNAKLLVPILLLVFVSFTQLDFAQEYMVSSVNYLMLQLAYYPNILHDLSSGSNLTTYVGVFNAIREILLVELLILAISSIITLVFLVATVSSSYEAYTAKVLGLKDIILKIRNSWKRPIVTNFYLILLTFGITLLYAISIVITSFLAVNSWALLFFGVIALSVPFCYFYMATLWMVSLVVSVLEDGFSGLKAIGRAAELMNGKRLQASLMMVLFTLAYCFVVVIVKVLASYTMRLSVELALTIPFANGVYCLFQLFMFVVYTVFYHEWKTSHEEKEGKGFYLPVAIAEA